MREYRGFRIALVVTLVLHVIAIALCVKTYSIGGSCAATDSFSPGTLPLPGGFGYPPDAPWHPQSSIARSALVSYLSPVIASSLVEKRTALSLEEKGDIAVETNDRSAGRIDNPKTLSEADIAYMVQRARERIELAKKVIQEQECSAKIEHLRARRELAKKSTIPR
jgi:hypothetical protein